MTPLARKIVEEIQREGPIPFSRFMELALYCPKYGYYEKEEDTVGKAGDFYTSVSVGPLFGRLLAFAFAHWIAELPRASGQSVALVEAGAHNGQLGADVLSSLRLLSPECFETVHYWVLEPSAKRQQWQRRALEQFEGKVRWAPNLEALAGANPNGLTGVIFANELLDAMPIRRFGWSSAEGKWREWGVDCRGEMFQWRLLGGVPDLPKWIAQLPRELLHVLPDGFILEHSETALTWWQGAAQTLSEGWLVTFDYGMKSEELLVPERLLGTLRSYRRHHAVGNVLESPGEQDLTAHVNFSTLLESGESAGLVTTHFTSQARFLTEVAARMWAVPGLLNDWNEKEKRQFQTLTHPQFLGSAFKVLVQRRTRESVG